MSEYITKELNLQFQEGWDREQPTVGILWYTLVDADSEFISSSFVHALNNITGAQEINDIYFFVSHTGSFHPLDEGVHAHLFVLNSSEMIEQYRHLDESQSGSHFTMFSLHVPFTLDITLDALDDAMKNEGEENKND